MLFNSVQFAFFLPIVFVLYWFVFNKSYKWQNMMLLIASYYFYGCWDWRFLFLLAFSTGLDFFSGLQIYNSTSQKRKKLWLIISVGLNLSFLGFFKYYNFFIDSFANLLGTFGFEAHYTTLSIVLPVGISFYTFHGLSYVFDIYNGKIKPRTNWVDYTLFVSFFPLLVAGPIERATHLLPQIEKPRLFNYSKSIDGLRQILWGLFKKVVIADNCANLCNEVFNNSHLYSGQGSMFVLAAILFTIQIYGDFSGYSDIALGTARLFGFELLVNFKYPFFSRDIAEFWRRWHISLTSWFKDYLYIPLGGSRKGMFCTVRNTFIIFLVSGFWHGANWTFLMWGAINALYIMPSIIIKHNRQYLDVVAMHSKLPSTTELFLMIRTFLLACLAFIFFRSADVTSGISFISEMFSWSVFTVPQKMSYLLIALIIFCFGIEWIGRRENNPLSTISRKLPLAIRWALYIALAFMVFLYYKNSTDFIYFQF